MQRMMKIALLALVGLPAAATAQSAASGRAAPPDTASAWSAPEGSYVLSSQGKSVTVRVTRTDAGLGATLQKSGDADVVTALSVSVNGPELIVKFQPGESVLTMTLRRSGSAVTGVLDGEGERIELTGTRNG